MPDALSDAKAALANANKTFPSSSIKSAGAATPAPTIPAKTVAPSLGAELAAKKTMVDKARSVLPKMHNGGTVKADGDYNLKAGEHVLTAPEAAKARQHALMASGMKSLAKPGPRARTGTGTITVTPMPSATTTDKTLASPKKQGMPSVTISPSPKAGPGFKAQSAIAHPGETARPTASDISKT
jgi:hypothetical protein